MSSHAHVKATNHAHRTHARAQLAGAAASARASSLTHPPGTAVVDLVTGQKGVVVSGKKVHVHAESAEGADGGSAPGPA